MIIYQQTKIKVKFFLFSNWKQIQIIVLFT